MNPSILTRSERVATDLFWLTFDREPQGYGEPGQFVTVAMDGQNSFFAIASSPGEPLELLVKGGGGPAGGLTAARPGDTIAVGPAIGEGFRAQQTTPAPLVALVNGSAISAVRPVIRAELAAGLPRPVHLLYGVLTADHVPWRDELQAWSEAGIATTLVADHPSPGWTGPTGYVQDQAREMGLVRADVALLLCGVPEMMRQSAALWRAAGIPDARILLNYGTV